MNREALGNSKSVYFFILNLSADEAEQAMSQDKGLVKLEGVVEEVLPSTTFRVRLDNGHLILAHISGRMRVNYIRLLPGDRVLLEMSPYDLTKGRITQRL